MLIWRVQRLSYEGLRDLERPTSPTKVHSGLGQPVVDAGRPYKRRRTQAVLGVIIEGIFLIDRSGNVSWIRDYGALENGGIMYVVMDELVRELRPHL